MLAKAYLEITNVCNLHCAFCPGTKRAPRVMTPAEFRVLATKLVGHTEYLYLHLMGEPLGHPQLDEILTIAAARGFHVCITTNGTLLARRRELLLAHAAHIHKISISLHSFEANDGTDFDAYLASALGFAREASAHGILSVLRLWNLDGKTAGLNGNNDAILARLHDAFPGEWRETRGGYRLADRCFLEFGERFEWPDPDAADYGDERFCMALRDQVGVLCDGTVVPCCLDAEGRLALGNLFDTDLAAILASPAARQIYDSFSARRAPCELCRRCGYSTRFSK